jgi:hypothetical protein
MLATPVHFALELGLTEEYVRASPCLGNGNGGVVDREETSQRLVRRGEEHPSPYNEAGRLLVGVTNISNDGRRVLLGVDVRARGAGEDGRGRARPAGAGRQVVLRGEAAADAGLEISEAVVDTGDGRGGAAKREGNAQGNVAELLTILGAGAGADDGLVGDETIGQDIALGADVEGEGVGKAPGTGGRDGRDLHDGRSSLPLVHNGRGGQGKDGEDE